MDFSYTNPNGVAGGREGDVYQQHHQLHQQYPASSTPGSTMIAGMLQGMGTGTSIGGRQTQQIPPVDVDDALQYTPLSSVMPYIPDTITMPVVFTHNAPSLLGIDQNNRQALATLDCALEGNSDSKFVSKYYAEVLTQMEKSATGYRFKSVPNTTKKTSPGAQQRAVDILKSTKSGRFAEMVFGKSSIPYSKAVKSTPTPIPQPPIVPLPTPQTHDQAPPTPARSTAPPQQFHTPVSKIPRDTIPATTPLTFRNISAIAPTPQYRQTFQVQIPVLTPARSITPQTNDLRRPTMSPVASSESQQGSQVLNVVLINPSPSIDRSQYIKVDSKVLPRSSKSRKRKRYASDSDEPIPMGEDQRMRADGFLNNFQNLVKAIFQAEDSIEHDVSTISPEGADWMRYWIPGTTGGDSPCLAKGIQVKLGKLVRDVINVRRFGQVPVDDLTRLQKLCENTLKRADGQNINPPIGDDENELTEWYHRCVKVEDGLKASRTILQIMLGGREESQIYSEDILTSILYLLKSLIEGYINPMIEMRPSGDLADQFKAAFKQKSVLTDLLKELKHALRLFTTLIAAQEITESTLTSALYMAASIVFIENSSSDKESVFDLRMVELFRKEAMEILTKIFARYPDERSTIFEQILQNLEKLPVNRVMARQFKLVEGGKNIQLVSALIMQLIQTSGAYQAARKKRKSDDEDEEPQYEDVDERTQAEADPNGAVRKLRDVCHPLYDSAMKNAASIVGYLVKKAMTSSKTGDQPYRHLLDLFTEDFLSVLGSPEWPAAELLLRSLLVHMCGIIDQDKQTVGAKTMALDMLGLMGSGICDMNVHLRESHRSREGGNTLIESSLADLTDKYLEAGTSGGGKSALETIELDILDWQGPFRIAMEHLVELRGREPSFHSACGFFHTAWSHKVCTFFEKLPEDEDDGIVTDIAETAAHLRRMAVDGEWDDDMNIVDLSHSQIRLAYTLVVLNMPFCTGFDALMTRLVRCVDDNQAQSRSKSLKSINQLISKDTSILERTNLVSYIIKKCEDASPLVRDSAVDILGRCFQLKPELETRVAFTIVARANDTGVAVRKRSMKILKDIYLHTKKEQLKVHIAEALIGRIKDLDTGVAEQAKKTFEEIWIAPFYTFVDHAEEGNGGKIEITPKLRIVANDRVSVIVKVVQKEATLQALMDVIKSLLSTQDNKNSARNFRVCKTILACMFEDLLDKQGDDDRRDRENIMQTLTVFASANPRLFSPDQLELLQPYIQNLTSEDLGLFRSVIIVYRHALAILTSRNQIFLGEIQSSLLKNLTRLPAAELGEVIHCLNTISIILDAPDRLIRVTISCLTNILKARGTITDQAEAKRIVRTIHIVGLLGHYCDFEKQISVFKTSFPRWNGDSVSGLIADTIEPFCRAGTEPSVRRAAIEGLGNICQTHAPQFLKDKVLHIIDTVFEENDTTLCQLMLSGMKGFFFKEESRSDAVAEEAKLKDSKKKKGSQEEPRRLTAVGYTNQNDGVSTSLAQKYLKDIMRIATASQDRNALVAVEVIGSILRQGLVHPREVVPALVALETSTEPSIANLAFKEHKALHSKHETIVERGYVDGVRACFKYQRDVVGDSCGSLTDPWTAKLRPLYDIVRDGTRKLKNKFLINLVQLVDFDIATFKLDADPAPLEYARFISENLAFLDYGTIEDVYIVVTTMEKVVANTGMLLGHAIDTEIFMLKMELVDNAAKPPPDPARLTLLSSTASVLTMLWAARNYLRKAYGVNESKCREYRKNRLKANDPILNKTPIRNPMVNPHTCFEQIEGNAKGRDTEEEKMEACRQFMEILNIDPELKVEDEDEEAEPEDMIGAVTPEGSDAEGSVKGKGANTPKGRKRKGSVERGTGGTKRRKSASTKRKRSKERG